jgi:predicted NACHT family NTPase
MFSLHKNDTSGAIILHDFLKSIKSFDRHYNMEIKEGDPILFIKDIEWNLLKEICIEAQSKYNLLILEEPISDVDKGFLKNLFTNSLKEESSEKKPPLSVQISLNLHEISKFMIKQKKWMLEIRSTLNSQTLSIEECCRILLDCHEMFSFFHKIVKNKTLEKFFIERDIVSGVVNEYRLSIPINTLFDTGLNFSILGDAGAGKTTTLQIQAQRLLSDSRAKELVLYLPLARVFNAFRKNSKAPTNKRIHLFDAIFEYCRSEGEDITEAALAETLEKTNSIILLDGIDEIINIEPAILEEIEILRGRFPNSQVIFSARIGGGYLNPEFPEICT